MEARAQNATPVLTTIGIDIGKDVFHIVGFGAAGKMRYDARLSDWRSPTRSRNYLHALSVWKPASA
jgi:hypothetical protein